MCYRKLTAHYSVLSFAFPHTFHTSVLALLPLPEGYLVRGADAPLKHPDIIK